MKSCETVWMVEGSDPDHKSKLYLKATFDKERETYLSIDGHFVSLSPGNCIALRNELNRIISE